MGLFDVKVCVFSEVRGIVIMQGLPVEGAVIERKYQLNKDEVIDKTNTDASGYFSMPPICVSSIRTLYPHQPSILQVVNIYFGDDTYQAFGFHKGNYKSNGERGDKPLLMMCELTNKKERRSISDSRKYLGMCELVDSLPAKVVL
jgi:hypothetical protein